MFLLRRRHDLIPIRVGSVGVLLAFVVLMPPRESVSDTGAFTVMLSIVQSLLVPRG